MLILISRRRVSIAVHDLLARASSQGATSFQTGDEIRSSWAANANVKEDLLKGKGYLSTLRCTATVPT
jgi:hypothetical protein